MQPIFLHLKRATTAAVNRDRSLCGLPDSGTLYYTSVKDARELERLRAETSHEPYPLCPSCGALAALAFRLHHAALVAGVGVGAAGAGAMAASLTTPPKSKGGRRWNAAGILAGLIFIVVALTPLRHYTAALWVAGVALAVCFVWQEWRERCARKGKA